MQPSALALLQKRKCAIVDGTAQLDKTDLLFRFSNFISDFICEAIRLPDSDPWQRDEPDDLTQDLAKPRANLDIGHKAWQDPYELLKEKLGDSDLYWEVFDPVAESEAIQATRRRHC